MDALTLFIIFDSTNPGVSCRFSNVPPLSYWVMSLVPPQPIESLHPLLA